MAGKVIFEIDTSAFERLASRLASAGKNIRPALARAINHTGDKARTQIARALVKQTGVKYGAVRKAMTSKLASAGTLMHRIISKGGYISLKEFGARQTSKGVSAAPWNKRRVFAHTFIIPSLGGHVFERRGHDRLPIRKLWGPAIPKEMVKDQSKKAFETTVASDLPSRIEHEVTAILTGIAKGD
jgi:hypothetical protein